MTEYVNPIMSLPCLNPNARAMMFCPSCGRPSLICSSSLPLTPVPTAHAQIQTCQTAHRTLSAVLLLIPMSLYKCFFLTLLSNNQFKCLHLCEEFPVTASFPPLLNTFFMHSVNIYRAFIWQTLFWVLGVHKETKQIQIPLLLKLIFYGGGSGVDAEKSKITSCMVASALWDTRAAKGNRVLGEGGQKGPHREVDI